ncbi:glycosyltransferase [Buttiauxella ferragutiae]|uniref:glycosyltransferase n=1 Tax=Buttiauxella ferragutiae TaxID=82989 RepID=UPI001F52E6D1|nr:glycosyltransferase [Buttiauxella ferragutiae]UNK62860.1 glycosyltransferase [Buttiauxella ferragutiae]
MKIIIIATAAVEGGALSVLNDLVGYIKRDNNFYIVYINEKALNKLPQIDNVEYRIVDTKTLYKRFYFDFYGFNNFVKQEKPSLCFNMQNVAVRTSCPQIVFIHQPIPFSDVKFNFFNRVELRYNMYKYIYFAYMRLNNAFAKKIIVQTHWMNKAVKVRLKRKESDIIIVKPNVDISLVRTWTYEGGNDFFYPAAEYSYKNHEILIDAFALLSKEFLRNNHVRLVFTLEIESLSERIINKIKHCELAEFVIFLGKVSRDDVLNRLLKSRALVFPSILESFGVPLVEAAKLSVPIIASDLEYSREVLNDYQRVIYCTSTNAEEWSHAIERTVNRQELTESISPVFSYGSDWDKIHYIYDEIAIKQ